MSPLQPGRRAKGRSLKQNVLVVLAVVAAAWLVAFVSANSEDVRVSFVFAHVTLSLIWVMIICIVLAGLIGYLLGRRGQS